MLAVAVGGLCTIAYLELRTVLLAAAKDRAVSAAQRISAALDESGVRIRREAERVANDSVVRAMLARPLAAGSVDAFRDAFAREHARAPQVIAIGLFARDGSAIASADSAHGVTTDWLAASEGESTRSLPAGARGFGPIEIVAGGAQYDVTVPVFRASSRDTAGFLVVTRQLASPSNALISTLIGARASVLVGTLDGAAWTDLVHPLVHPRDPSSLGAHGGGVIQRSARPVSMPWQVVVEVPEAAALAPARRFLFAMLGAGALLLAVGAVAAWRITREVTGPLAEIGAATDEFAAGDYTRRAHVARQDELGQLADAFNAMAERVAAASSEGSMRAAQLEAANRALRESEARFRHIAANVPGMVYQFVYRSDGSRGFTVVSDGVRDLFGVEPEAALRDPTAVFGLVHDEDREALHSSGRNAVAALVPWHWEGRAVLADGTEKWIQAAAHNALQPDGSVVCDGMIMDVTERRRAAQRLEESEIRFHLAARATRDIVYDWNIKSDTLFWGDTLTSAFGYDPHGIEPSNDWWIARIHPDDASNVTAGLARALEGTADSWSAEYRFRCADGTYAVVLDRAYVLRDDAGRAIRLVGSMSDLTERKALEEQLRQAQKMEAVGQLAGGIAHDFNNILTAITGFSELLLADTSPEDERYDSIGEIRAGANRAAALTRQLLAFSRRQMLQPRLLDLNRSVRAVEAMLRRLIVEDITLVISLDPAIGHVRADPGQIEQVLMNLVVNARDAMPRGGSLTIETTNVEFHEAERIGQRLSIPAGQYVRIAVSDSGHGMDETTRARVFEPFFTTKEPGKGTGLGLSTVYGIVKQSGGFIWCYSEPGAGTVFKIYLPRVAAEVAEAAERTPSLTRAIDAGLATETILLVEDDEAVRDVSRRILVQRGYTVLEATNGAEALRVCADTTRPIDLIVSDMVMPEMNGPELGRHIRERHPGTALLFMSGYTRDAALRQSFLEPGTAFIEKPFTPATLAQRVREVLDARAARGNVVA